MKNDLVMVEFKGTSIFSSRYFGYINGECIILDVGKPKMISRKAYDYIKIKLRDGIVLVNEIPKSTKKAKVNAPDNKNRGKVKGKKNIEQDIEL